MDATFPHCDHCNVQVNTEYRSGEYHTVRGPLVWVLPKKRKSGRLNVKVSATSTSVKSSNNNNNNATGGGELASKSAGRVITQWRCQRCGDWPNVTNNANVDRKRTKTTTTTTTTTTNTVVGNLPPNHPWVKERHLRGLIRLQKRIAEEEREK
jgi:hypothetical protein